MAAAVVQRLALRLARRSCRPCPQARRYSPLAPRAPRQLFALRFQVLRFSGLLSFLGWVRLGSQPARRLWFAPWRLRLRRCSSAFRVAPARQGCSLRAPGAVVVQGRGRSVRYRLAWVCLCWCSCRQVFSRRRGGSGSRPGPVGFSFRLRRLLPCFSFPARASGLFCAFLLLPTSGAWMSPAAIPGALPFYLSLIFRELSTFFCRYRWKTFLNFIASKCITFDTFCYFCITIVINKSNTQ